MTSEATSHDFHGHTPLLSSSQVTSLSFSVLSVSLIFAHQALRKCADHGKKSCFPGRFVQGQLQVLFSLVKSALCLRVLRRYTRQVNRVVIVLFESQNLRIVRSRKSLWGSGYLNKMCPNCRQGQKHIHPPTQCPSITQGHGAERCVPMTAMHSYALKMKAPVQLVVYKYK